MSDGAGFIGPIFVNMHQHAHLMLRALHHGWPFPPSTIAACALDALRLATQHAAGRMGDVCRRVGELESGPYLELASPDPSHRIPTNKAIVTRSSSAR